MQDEKRSTDGTSRRSVLRMACAAGGGLLGTAAASRPAAATYCPRPPGYWANREWPGGVTTLTVGGRTMRAAEWRGFLLDPPRDDKAASLARQVVATALNFRKRSPSDPDCAHRPLDHLGGRTVNQVKERAEQWLARSRFDEAAPQTDWEVRVTVDGERQVVDGESLRDTLARFNAGRLHQLDCGCEDREPVAPRTDDRERPPEPTPGSSESTASDEDSSSTSPDEGSDSGGTVGSRWPFGPW